MNEIQDPGVAFPAGKTATTFLESLVDETLRRFPDDLKDVPFSSGRGFRDTFATTLADLEARRMASPKRVEIAEFMVRRSQEQFRLATQEGDAPLADAVSAEDQPCELATLATQPSRGLVPKVTFRGRAYEGAELHELAQWLLDNARGTRTAADALRWIADLAASQGGVIDLSGHSFAILGAGAELAPTRMLLEAGARVLWVDVVSPEKAFGAEPPVGGELHYIPAGADLLANPGAVRRAIEEFSDGKPTHLGLLAYAGGRGREWRLTAAMNAVAMELDPKLVASVAMFISPASITPAEPEDVERRQASLSKRPWWSAALSKLGALPSDGHHEAEGMSIVQAIVPLQGASYQAAQYISKRLVAETFASKGTSARATGPVRVSANVPGITATRSLSHPIFEAGFLGAESFGVEIFAPEATRGLAGLLMIHDVLNPKADEPTQTPAGAVCRSLSQQLHGGINALPDTLFSTIRVASVVGLARRPKLLWQLATKRKTA